VFLRGYESNTFTGNVEVSGRRNHLVLEKLNGALAVRGDILVRDKAIVRFAQSSQLLTSSSITLKKNGELQTLAAFDITNTFHNLTIEDSGTIHFNHSEGNSHRSKYYIKVDDLIINQGGHLEVRGWQEGRDFLLIRKSSKTLDDALRKIGFAGYDRNNIHLEEYDAEYWSISAMPEPTTYGAIMGVGGLALVAWRKRKRHRNEEQNESPHTRLAMPEAR